MVPAMYDSPPVHHVGSRWTPSPRRDSILSDVRRTNITWRKTEEESFSLLEMCSMKAHQPRPKRVRIGRARRQEAAVRVSSGAARVERTRRLTTDEVVLSNKGKQPAEASASDRPSEGHRATDRDLGQVLGRGRPVEPRRVVELERRRLVRLDMVVGVDALMRGEHRRSRRGRRGSRGGGV